MHLAIDDKTYGQLLPYVLDDDVTDINWNGQQLWLNHLKKGRYFVPGFSLEEHFIEQFAQKLKNSMGVDYNPCNPVLEAETEELRISIIHSSVSATGTSISIRKTPAVRRLNYRNMIETGYCTERMAQFLASCIQARMSIVFCGLPGAGKTELLKACTAYIPGNQRVITIEDTLEIRYRKINPGKDSIELKVNKDSFTYEDALKSVLRQLPDWILLSEARSVEVKYLLECLSNGTHCMTTLHADDVRKIPDRMLNMMPEYKESIKNNIYSFVDVGVLVRADVGLHGVKRNIEQIGLFARENERNHMKMIYDGRDVCVCEEEFPSSIRRKFKLAGIENPFSLPAERGEK